MSFSKAQDLIRPERPAASRRIGISLNETCEEFGISHRTAQLMTDAPVASFTIFVVTDGDHHGHGWRLADPMLDRLQPRQETAVEALEIGGGAALAHWALSPHIRIERSACRGRY